MPVKIKDISGNLYDSAVELFANAFTDDPLFLFAFPDENERIKQTRIMYEFVVNDMVPALNLNLKGAFEGEILTGCMIYSAPERLAWDEKMNYALDKMMSRADNDRVNLIGEFAVLEGLKLGTHYFYGNELAVKKQNRRRGIGRTLCNFLIDECRRHPLAEGIGIDTANGENIKLYEDLGWKLTEVRDFYSIKKYFMWRQK